MLGAELTAGDHEIELRYSPELRHGSIIKAPAALLFLLMLLAERSVKKKRRLAAAQAKQQETAENTVPETREDVSAPEVTNEKPESDDGLPRD